MATKTESMFWLKYEVVVDIDSKAESIWEILTDAKKQPEWNSTVTSIIGDIRLGNTLSIKVPISERTFTPKVTVFDPPKVMVWSDGFASMFTGSRTYTLTPKQTQTQDDRVVTEFKMVEEFSGLMLPLIKGSLPDFRPPFDTYAADLKRAVECTTKIDCSDKENEEEDIDEDHKEKKVKIDNYSHADNTDSEKKAPKKKKNVNKRKN